MTTDQIIADLKRKLSRERVLNALLQARLGLKEGEIEGQPQLPGWAERLTPREAALVGALLHCYPRTLSRYELDDLIPKNDRAKDRDLKTIDAFASNARRKLGRDVIENDWGRGFRCSAEFHKQWGEP